MTPTFQHYGNYTCICGRTFNNSQAYNAHRKHCRLCMGDDYVNNLNKNSRNQLYANTEKRHQQIEERKTVEQQQWIAEQHICEKCGKVMVEKYGSGRFCCKSCASSHPKSLSAKLKVVQTTLGRPIRMDDVMKIIFKTPDWKEKQVAEEPIPAGLPDIIPEKRNKGFFNRKKMSYAESFWKEVLDNNLIQYEHDFIVQRPKGLRGVYRLDFLIGNVDVEIDGQLHNSDYCCKKDVIRTEYLQSIGYVVYRIKWINPRTMENKRLVNKQIDDLFKFLNVSRIQ